MALKIPMIRYTFNHIAEIINGKMLQTGENAVIEQLVPDSRKIIFPKTSLFFALTGPARDGHSFIEESYQKGVRNFVISKQLNVSRFPAANFVQTADCLQALQQLAAWHRRQFSIPVIGITGSNGKTIVKEWLNQLLEEEFNIVRSPKSYNSQIGVPLSVWQLNDQHELGIFEAGISQPDEMEKLQKIIEPTIGIFTNIGEAHSEGFPDIIRKVEEKSILFGHAEKIIYCSDETEIGSVIKKRFGIGSQNAANKPVELYAWGKKGGYLQILQEEKEISATNIKAFFSGEEINIILPFTDDASIHNAITCYCVLLQFNIPVETIQRRMLRLRPVSMRLELKKGINHCSIINDSYSADLSSLKIALDFLSEQKQHPKKTVIISDFLQSGMDEEELYTQIAASLEQHKADRIIGIGEKIHAHRQKFSGLVEKDFYRSTHEFISEFRESQFHNEAILLKGARVFAFEKIDQLLAEKLHHTILEIDLNALGHNLKQYRQILSPGTRIMAMVKAFAYGSGSHEIAGVLQFHKVDYLGVAYADEAVALRRAGITLPIMVMNTEEDSFQALTEYRLQPVIYSSHVLEQLEHFLEEEGVNQFPVHIEINTGMNRLGFEPGQLNEAFEILRSDLFKVESAFTHLAASEDPQQNDFTLHQAEIFMKTCEALQKQLSYSFLKHIANTAAVGLYPQLQLDMVRLGIGLYGIDSAELEKLDLQEVSTLKTTIAQIRHIREGETVSYGRKGVAEKDALIATVRIGYADGYPRSLSNGVGKMLVNGYPAPIIGTICMDMTMIDITGLPDVKEGDEVIVFGKEFSVNKLAHWANTIPYEILTGVSQRVKRIYYQE